MDQILDEREARVLGCLIEKERTTPDYYPLSLNALVNACNQKSNRNPVVSFAHEEVARALEDLRWKGWTVVVDEAGSRTEKYRHSFLDKTGLTEKQMAVLAELMLRGPQTGGEIRGRASRMVPFDGLAEVQQILRELAEREEPMAVLLPRQKGRKERRYAHLFSGEPEFEAEIPAVATAAPPVPQEDGKMEKLEEEIESLQNRIESLEQTLAEFRAQFE